MKGKQLSIRLYGKEIGTLLQDDHGKLVFTYNEAAGQPISMSMPLQVDAYTGERCEAYFGGLLPEGDHARKMLGKRFGISPYNTFSMLKAIGHDCAGAISCHEMNDDMTLQNGFHLNTRIISDDELYQHIIELPEKPLFIDVDGLRLSLAGVQDKAAVCMVDNQIALAEEGCPTTHLLKPSSARFKDIVINEYFCMKLAKRSGLTVPEVSLYKIKDINFMLIERYDRQIEGNKVYRIHQEDFCQASGVPSSRKYQNEGGPNFEDCFNLLNQSAQPAVDRNALVSAMVFNYLIGNMDAHGKNFSLLHTREQKIQLAPFYDFVSTRVYPELSKKMAMKIGSQYDAKRVQLRHWEALANRIGYRYLSLKRLLEKKADQLLPLAEAERDIYFQQHGEELIISQIVEQIRLNAKRVLDTGK